MGEFDLIATYFKRPTPHAVLGVGDDCALLSLAPGHHLAVSTDMLVAGRHFVENVDPTALGHKALAVNLSDLAAMGATPKAFTLALALPRIDASWLAKFSQGLLALADAHGCELVGGDTTAGPLTLSITVMGEVPVGQALTRAGAKVGDDIYVSGDLGWARLGLAAQKGELQLPSELQTKAQQALDWPQPAVALGQALRNMAHAAIDLSDGLSGDLGHILAQSKVGAVLDETALAQTMGEAGASLGWSTEQMAQWVLAGGDDYALCVTAPPQVRTSLATLTDAQGQPYRLHRIGQITESVGLRLRDATGLIGDPMASSAFDHFAGDALASLSRGNRT
jgi:thiamine-monophosphate kinase